MDKGLGCWTSLTITTAKGTNFLSDWKLVWRNYLDICCGRTMAQSSVVIWKSLSGYLQYVTLNKRICAGGRSHTRVAHTSGGTDGPLLPKLSTASCISNVVLAFLVSRWISERVWNCTRFLAKWIHSSSWSQWERKVEFSWKTSLPRKTTLCGLN